MPDTENEIPDAVPAIVGQALPLLWIGLFGGRWIVVSLLQWNGLLKPEQTAALDENVFSRCYLILLALTLLVAALRWMRGNAAPQDRRETPPASAPRSRQESRNP